MQRLIFLAIAAAAVLLVAASANAQTRPAVKLTTKETPLGSLADASRYSVSRDSNHIASVMKKGGKFLVTRDGQSGSEYDWIVASTLTFTADSQHIAYIVQQGGMFVVTDDKEGKHYHEVVKSQLWVSLAGSRIAYIARAKPDGKPFMVIDGEEGKEYDQVGGLNFSADGKRYSYAAETGGKQLFVVDGTATPQYDKVVAPFFTFSPDGKRTAYVVLRQSENKVVAIVDGQEHAVADEISRPVFSPDSQHVAMAVRRGEKMAILLDGKELKQYDRIVSSTTMPAETAPAGGIERLIGETIRFSPDSKRLAYAAGRKEKVRDADGKGLLADSFFYVLDGQELRGYDSLGPFLFSPDSKRSAYIAVKNKRVVAVIDGSEGKYYEEIRQPQFSPDSKRFVYLASREGQSYCVTDNSESPAYASTGNLIAFSGDGANMAYVAARGRTAFVVRNGVEGQPYNFVAWDTLTFSPDGKHLAYAAVRDEKPWIIVDGQELPTAAGPLVASRLVFDSADALHALIVRDKQVIRLQIEIGAP